MTRLLIVSDTHGEVIKLEDLLRKYKGQFDIFIHLGDRLFDFFSMNETALGNAKTYLISGNMEMDIPMENYPVYNDAVFEVEQMRIFATHGHRYSVHSTLIFLKKEARKQNVKLVLYGHTHEKELFVEDDIMYFNPGALKNSDYGYIQIDGSEVVNIEQGYLAEKM